MFARLCVLVTFFIAINSFEQSAFLTPKVVLEPWDATSDRVIDVELHNPSAKKVYILRMEKHLEWKHVFSSSTIEPGGTLTVRLQMNPLQKGKFEHTLYFQLSDHDQPIPLTIKGNNLELGKRIAQECPDFNVIPSRFTPQNIEVNVIDKFTGAPLSNVRVILIRNGNPAGELLTDRDGYDTRKLTVGYYYFSSEYTGYYPFEAGAYLSFQNTSITLALTPIKENDPIALKEPVYTNDDELEYQPIQKEEPTTIEIEDVNEKVEPKTEIPALPTIKKDTLVEEKTVAIAIPELSTLEPTNFESTYFKPINVTFVLDISSSMKQYGRMELLKYTLQQLTQQLRSEDYISIVTYADEAEVALTPTKGNSKSEIERAITNLVAGGYTAGGLGIKLGYKEVLKELDSNAANMVYLITDGAFNKSSDNYQKTVQKYASQGVTFHVVGIKINSTDSAKMQEAANFGKGTFVSIQKLSEAQSNLFQSIRRMSYKK